MIRASETSFYHIFEQKLVSVKMESLQFQFRDPITHSNLHQLIGNHINDLNIKIGGEVVFQIDKFLLINLSPEIKLINSNQVEVVIPWDELGLPLIRIYRLDLHQVECIIYTKIDNNEIININLNEYHQAQLLLHPLEDVTDIHPVFSSQYSHIFNNTLSLNLLFGCCRGFLFTSTQKFPKVTSFELILNNYYKSRSLPNNGFWNQAVQKIGINMYYMPFAFGDSFTNYKHTSSVTFYKFDNVQINMTFSEKNDNDNIIIIYGVQINRLKYVYLIAANAYINDYPRELPFESKCIIDNIADDQLSELKMLELTVKYLDI